MKDSPEVRELRAEVERLMAIIAKIHEQHCGCLGTEALYEAQMGPMRIHRGRIKYI